MIINGDIKGEKMKKNIIQFIFKYLMICTEY